MYLWLEYAYPTSTNAGRYGYGDTGCFYVSRGDSIWRDRETLLVIRDDDGAKERARMLLGNISSRTGVPIGKYSL